MRTDLTHPNVNEKVIYTGLRRQTPADSLSERAILRQVPERARAVVMATLEVCSESGGRQLFELTSDETLVGREHFCDIVLRTHTVSRQHARITRGEDGYYIEDLASLNGTYLNGRRVEGRTLIKDQDRIHFYEIVTVFHAGALPPVGSETIDGDTATGEAVRDARKDQLATHDMSAKAAGAGGPKKVAGRANPNPAAPAQSRPNEQHRDLPEPAERTPAVARATSTTGLLSDSTETSCPTKFRAALKISLDLEGGLDLDDILPKILDSLFEIFPQASRGYILLAEGGDKHLVPRALKQRQNESGHSMTFGPISRKTALHVMSTAEALLMDDALGDAASENQSVFDIKSLSMICAPLMGPSGRPLGILYLDTTDRERRFTQDDLDVLVGVATIAGQQVEASASRQNPGDARVAESQPGTAKQVQLQFLPQSRPQVPGYKFFDHYQPADEVGGDYFGYMPLPDGRLALAIGDVAGKGISAALLMAHFCAEVRYCLATSRTPAEAVELLNQDLASESLNYHFVTFALCVLDPLAHRLTVVNAGHLPPLLRRGHEIEALGGAESGMPLGCAAGPKYNQIEVPFERGDTLLLYTDGINEAMNVQGDVYGSKRVRETIADAPVGADQVGQALLDDVRRFVRGRLQSDDICLVCFARES